MAVLRRSSQRMSGSIWPGFVDAMTAILLVLMFVLTIFMVVQSMLQDTISGQESELDSLTGEVNALAAALGLEQQKTNGLETALDNMRSTLSVARNVSENQAQMIDNLEAETAHQSTQILAFQTQVFDYETRVASFEAQVASLIAERDDARATGTQLTASIADLEAAQATLISEQEALQLALVKARHEIDASVETARLAAARREAVEELLAQLRREAVQNAATLDAKDVAISTANAEILAQAAEMSEAEKARLVDAATLAVLREKLAGSDSELTAMTLALEAARRDAEETMTLLAAANAQQAGLKAQVSQDLSEADRQAALLATARSALTGEQSITAESQRKVAALNAQVSQLRRQLSALQATLDVRDALDVKNNVQIDALTTRLNTALAQVAAEEKYRAELEKAERMRLEEEARKLENYRSEFFGRMREVLGNRDGVSIVGDRFVFSSEVLFEPASADLGSNGETQISRVAALLAEVSSEIPDEIDWVIRVDGHTDKSALSGAGEYKDNWELSQARALSVVRYMSTSLGFPSDRLLAAGFGEFQPVSTGDSPEDLAKNRRIELKLTEK